MLLQCHPYVNSTLRKAAAAQLVQCWGPPAVIKVKLKASKEVRPCTNGVPSGLCADLLLVSNPSWAHISGGSLPHLLHSLFLSLWDWDVSWLAPSLLRALGYSHWWEIVTPFRVS